MDLQVLNTLIEALQKLQTELPPNIREEKEIFAYKSGLNNAIFLAYSLLENNGEFPKSPFGDFRKD